MKHSLVGHHLANASDKDVRAGPALGRRRRTLTLSRVNSAESEEPMESKVLMAAAKMAATTSPFAPTPR